MIEDVQKHSVHTLVFRSLKRTHDMFLSDQAGPPPSDELAEKMKLATKSKDEYSMVQNLPATSTALTTLDYVGSKDTLMDETGSDPVMRSLENHSIALGDYDKTYDNDFVPIPIEEPRTYASANPSQALALANAAQQVVISKKAPTMPKPKWHAPWKLFRVISGHLGWVRCVAVEPGNQWFATGSADRVIKIWDLASGKLKLSLTGHISTVRGLAVSTRQPYLFSCGEDKQVKCWDLEYNKVIRHYHGHLSAIYGLALHPTLDVLISCGRDATARVWDMRTKANIHTLTGHTNTVAEVISQSIEPQVITGSHDCTIRLWDLAAGKTKATLTNHKKSVRALVAHPTLRMFASGSPDNLKQWTCPDGKFVQNLSGHNAIINCLALNADGVLVSGGDNGTLFFWDWKTGYNFQRLQVPVQPGSIESESGIFSCIFDKSGSRLITTEADKTVKIYKEDDTANEETHPINWKPDVFKRRRY